MKRVLFVDDEENLLNGLKHMLHRMRSSWHMSFVTGGEQALSLMDDEPEYDVVVSDLHMPGMHGAEFLKHVCEKFPEVIRIVLSGNLGAESLTEAAGVAHQILAKPCDPDHLRNILARAFTLCERMENSTVKTTLMRMGTLPSVPVLYWRIMEEINSAEPSVEKVAQIISKDPGMTAKVLKLVNSHTSPKDRVSNIMYATHMLGLENLKSFVLVAELFENVQQEELSESFDVDALWQHGLTVGECAKSIAEFETTDRRIIDDSYTAGLLHDIGLLILASKLPDEFDEVLQEARNNGITLIQAEKNVLGVTHAEVGAYLLDLWGLADDIVRGISHHFFPSGDPDEMYTLEEEENFTALTAVHAANYFCEEETATDEYGKAELDMVYLQGLELDGNVSHWWDLCKALL